MNTPTQEAMKWLLIQWLQSLLRIVIWSFLEIILRPRIISVYIESLLGNQDNSNYNNWTNNDHNNNKHDNQHNNKHYIDFNDEGISCNSGGANQRWREKESGTGSSNRNSCDRTTCFECSTNVFVQTHSKSKKWNMQRCSRMERWCYWVSSYVWLTTRNSFCSKKRQIWNIFTSKLTNFVEFFLFNKIINLRKW